MGAGGKSMLTGNSSTVQQYLNRLPTPLSSSDEAIVAAATLYIWLILPRLRRRPAWSGLGADARAVLAAAGGRLRALCGNSRTIAVAYAAEILGLLDEAKLLDWSAFRGAASAGRVMVIMGVVMILLRLVTRTAVSFKANA
jgi:hypothetical protein